MYEHVQYISALKHVVRRFITPELRGGEKTSRRTDKETWQQHSQSSKPTNNIWNIISNRYSILVSNEKLCIFSSYHQYILSFILKLNLQHDAIKENYPSSTNIVHVPTWHEVAYISGTTYILSTTFTFMYEYVCTCSSINFIF